MFCLVDSRYSLIYLFYIPITHLDCGNCEQQILSLSGLKMSKVLSFLGKALILMQIMGLSLMQSYVPAPSSNLGILNRTKEVKRVYYHRCGCPPEKVASHTCCCFTGKFCCSPQKPAATSHSRKDRSSQNYLSLSFCGCMDESYDISSGKFEFIGASFILFRGLQVSVFSPATRVNPDKLLFRPPVPPPEIALPI